MATQHLRAPQGQVDWALHEATIKRLYIDDGLSLHDVMMKMAEECSFHPTRAQYEYQFKKWGLQKNFKSRDMDKVARHVSQRRALGKASSVFYNDHLIPSARIQRSCSRQVLSLLENGRPRRHPPTLPPGFVIRTPSPELRQLSRCSSLRNYGPSRLTELPFAEFKRDLIRLFQSECPFFPLVRPMEAGQLQCHDARDLCRISSTEPLIGTPHSWMPHGYTFLDNSTRSDLTVLHAAPIPQISMAQFASMNKEVLDPLLTAMFPSSIRPSLAGQTSTGRPCSPISSDIAEIDIVGSAYAQLLIVSISNNFAGLSGLSHADVWRYLQHKSGRQIATFLGAASSLATTRALAEKLFVCALQARDAQGIDKLLSQPDLAIDVNCAVENFSSGSIFRMIRGTAIEYATAMGDLDTVKTLLRNGADVNKISCKLNCEHSGRKRGPELFDRGLHVRGATYGHGAIICALTLLFSLRELDPAVVTILEYFSINGLLIGPRIIEVALASKSRQIFSSLIRKSTAQDHLIWLNRKYFHKALEFLDHAAADSVICCLLKTLHDNNKLDELQGGQVGFRDGTLLGGILKTGNVTLVRHVLESYSIIPKDKFLAEAIDCASLDVVQYIINWARKTSPVWKPGGRSLEAAIVAKNELVIELLEDNGAMSGYDYKENLFGLAGACKVGNLTIFRRIMALDNLAAIYTSSLGYHLVPQCLVDSILARNEEMSLSLIHKLVDVKTNYLNNTKGYICSAVSTRSIAIVNALLDAGAPLLSPVLADAVEWGDLGILKRLLTAGAASNSNDMSMALCAAVASGQSTIADLLLLNGANINTSYWDDREGPSDEIPYQPRVDNPLSIAISNGSIEMVKYLLDTGADPSDPEALSAAMLQGGAIRQHFFNKYLERFPSRKTRSGANLLHLAIRNNDKELINRLVEHGIGLSNWEEIHEINEWYISRTTRRLPLAHAIQSSIDGIQVARLLLEGGADPNSVVLLQTSKWVVAKTPLLLAVESNSAAMVKLLLEFGADINAPLQHGICHTPLQKAAELGEVQLAELLITLGANVNAPASTARSHTALQHAAMQGHIALIDFLIQRGADVNAAPDKWSGSTALQLAAQGGFAVIVEHLLKCGADANAAPNMLDGSTALQFAAQGGFAGIVECLLKYGADVNSRASYGYDCYTALEEAAKNGRLDTVKLLLNANVKVDGSCRKRLLRAINMARSKGHLEVANLLEPYKYENSNDLTYEDIEV